MTAEKGEGRAEAARSAGARPRPRPSAEAPAREAAGAAAGDGRPRCAWPGSDPLMRAYHDEEWGVPVRGDRALYEKLVVDGFQAGLSWLIILRKREGLRRAFDGFDPERIARYGEADEARLLADPGIVRNRAKVAAAIGNARAFLALRDEGIGFAELIWSFTGGRTLQRRRRRTADIPAESPESRAMAKELKRRGFRFCGPTVCYAFMQAVGMVNDHLVTCFRHAELQQP